ncbi:3-hydroxyacyl-CoA dehydrogenase NAD-binding domain-containing protein [Corynebacterium sp. SCR221107]|uniref:3-hydroxyacyl-CoA dehydrogenase/enoyl-CoA hydratase family protein n=1 Tax=Corynebacterium sp. SCR221107 TaxID=3017361 RepID=UPI0022EC1AF5|nr:3-hydroxyacyl-CoA dehydrogenase/enoyl-CoA hydratase family protein [Corynebacterium sp. SCR221107]WBT08956.1 3-hydroxyacyl-CoA dehydrogenase NAD-binding domain-containing protein [Corynebacterium sp. SCR221107]
MTNQTINPIQRAAVIGAGSMGAGIAAHMANAGIDVLLLDMPAEGATHAERSARAQAGIDTQLKRRGFMRPEFASRVSAGNTEDDLDKLAEVDWVVEAIFENLDAKRDLYARIEPHLKPEALVTSNTSTIPLEQLVGGMPASRRERFAIVHFFNPPRVMRLVELVRGPETSEDAVATLRRAIERQLGKVALDCRDTPGFIANRIGNLWMAAGARIAIDSGLAPEVADACFGRQFGIPRTGIFGLFDYVGLQLVPPIWGSLTTALPETDAYHRYPILDDPMFAGLLERGLTGRTGPSGIYRGRDEVIASTTGESFEYRPRVAITDPAAGAKTALQVMETDSDGGRFAKATLLATLRYCLDTAPEICETVDAIDAAMELGYAWKRGPFKLADAIGLPWLREQFAADEQGVPPLLDAAIAAGGFYPAPGKVLRSDGTVGNVPEREGVVTVAEIVASPGARVVAENEAARVHLLDNGVGIFELITTLNCLSVSALEMLDRVAQEGADWGVRALVVANDEGRAFSAGADLNRLAATAEANDPVEVEKFIRAGSERLRALRKAPFPVVGAVRGVALGGGAELLMACDRTVIHAETRIGFPERNVGLYPTWCGMVRTLERLVAHGVDNPVATAFGLIAGAGQHLPFDLEALGVLGEQDSIVQSFDHVVGDAVALAATLIDGYVAPADVTLPTWTSDTPLIETIDSTDLTDNDMVIVNAIAKVYTVPGQATVDSETLADREIEFCVPLLSLPANQARARSMADTRKPLRN